MRMNRIITGLLYFILTLGALGAFRAVWHTGFTVLWIWVVCVLAALLLGGVISRKVWKGWRGGLLVPGVVVLFGGMLSKAGLLSLEMPSQYKEKSQKPLAQYDRFLMYYNGAFKEMLMPCGKLMQPEVDPDDLPII